MRRLTTSAAATLAGITLLLPGTASSVGRPIPEVRPVSTYATGLGEGSAEIIAYDADRAYVINTATTVLDVLSVDRAGGLRRTHRIDLAAHGAGGNSVAASHGLIAVALDAPVRTDPGRVVLLDRALQVRAVLTVGAVPDMVTFTPDGRTLLVANEGEPDDDYVVDPVGSISVIDVAAALRGDGSVRTAGFEDVDLPAGVRIFGPGATPAQDIEPEYITVAPHGREAYVTLQENNAIAVVDVRSARVTRVMALGLKDHRMAHNALDANDKDGIAIAPTEVPVMGMYQPDGIEAFRQHGRSYLITANEGDVREWGDYEEGERAGSIDDDDLDPGAFPDGVPAALARLTVSTATGDTDGDGDLDELHAFGARSFSIWTTDGQLVFDSGDDLERRIAELAPTGFNVSNSNNTIDNRSDDKGPEPEGVTTASIGGRLLAFIALERVGGLAVYDITVPSSPVFQGWANNRSYGGGAVGPDSGPEGITFVAAAGGRPDLVLVGNEVSGTVTAYEVTLPRRGRVLR